MIEKYKNEEILEQLTQAEKILVGIGEEFDAENALGQNREYAEGCNILKAAGFGWAIPLWNNYCFERLGDAALSSAIRKLSVILRGKDVFLVSTSINDTIAGSGIRAVMPCGSLQKKQCVEGCEEVLLNMTEEDIDKIWQGFEVLFEEGEKSLLKSGELLCLGNCPKCGRPLVLNTVYAENYNEHGYLDHWNEYTKWLQGTLNKKLLVLELGGGMRFPSVIRWPFEKVVFFNQKAFLCRVNEKLYHLTEELAEKGCGISVNAIDWLNQL